MEATTKLASSYARGRETPNFSLHICCCSMPLTSFSKLLFETTTGRQSLCYNRDKNHIQEDRKFAKQNQASTNVQVNNIEDSSEVTEEVLLTALRRVLSQYSSIQGQHGHWPGGYSGILFIMPLTIFALYVTRSLNDVLSSEHIREICRYIYNIQNEDGGWSTHTLGPSTMFGSCVNYATLRLLGEVSDGDNDALSKGRAWILSHGSATATPQWAKIYLSVIGVYDWSGNNPIIPELWMLPHFLPIHPGRFWCYCRMVYMPMSYIYAKRFVGPITPVILAMRDELYNVPYDEINWNDARRSCCKDDIIYPPSWMQNVAMASLNKFVEPVFNMWPMNKIRQRALTNIMCHIHYEDENSNYVGLCPINKVLNMICCWIENPNSDAFRLHLPRIDDFLWLAEDGMKCKVYNGCQCWETALAVQAYCSTGLAQEFGATLKNAHDFIKNAQVIENCPNYKSFYRERSKGSWTLSNGENSWAMADCTAECLKAVLLLSKIPPNHVGDPLGEERLYDAVDCLLSFANKDGTLSSAESQRTTPWVEGVDGKPALTGFLLQLLVGIKNVVGNGAKEPAVACGESEVFQWLLLKDRRLNTRVCFKEDNLGHKMDQFCLMCNNSVLEDVQCLFFFCPFATVLALPWNKLGSELGIYDHCINRKVAIWQAFLCGSY